MEAKPELKHYLGYKGRLVYLQKLEPRFTALYQQYMGKLDVATRVLTSTAEVFSGEDMERYIHRVSSDDSRVDFLVFDCAEGRLLGEVVLADIDLRNRAAHLRMAIAQQEDFGKGYGTEALLLALYHGFGMLPLHRIELEVLPYNTRAIHVYEKVGFVKEGIRRDACYFNHRYYDVLTMSMLEDTFRQQHLSGMAPLESLV
jgi:RimJ/RimL family protein N-acetyltransferase